MGWVVASAYCAAGFAAGAGADVALARSARREGRDARPGTAPIDGHRTGAGRVLVPALAGAGALVPGVAPDVPALPYLYFSGLASALAVADLRTHRLPDALVLPSFPVGAALLLVTACVDRTPGRLVSAAIGASVLLGLSLAALAVLGESLGMGDVKFTVLIGMFVGFRGVGAALVALGAGLVLAAAAAIALLLVTRRPLSARLPYGPFLGAGALVGILAGPTVSSVYLTLLRP